MGISIPPKIVAGGVGLVASGVAAGAAYNYVDRQRRAGVKEPNKKLATIAMMSGSALGLGALLVSNARTRSLVAAGNMEAAGRMSQIGRGAQLGLMFGPLLAYGAYNALFDTDGYPNVLDPVGNVQRRLDRSEKIGDKG
jgi:hypothetical protein